MRASLRHVDALLKDSLRRLGIGLFGLVGLFGAALGPLVGRTIDALVPWHATLAATVGLVAMHAVYTGAAGVHIAAVVVVCRGTARAAAPAVDTRVVVAAVARGPRARAHDHAVQVDRDVHRAGRAREAALAAAVVLVGSLLVLAAVVFFLATSITGGVSELASGAVAGLRRARDLRHS